MRKNTLMMMMTTNMEDIAKSSVAVSSEHGNHYVVDVEESVRD